MDLDLAFSRQGNVYIGERGNIEDSQKLAQDRVSRVYRSTVGDITGKSEWILPTSLGGREQTITLGAELRHERMNDPSTPRLESPEGDPTTGTLVNVSRGSVVDDPALTALPNVTLYPHHASRTEETRDRMAQLTRDNLDAFFAGRPGRRRLRFSCPPLVWPA